MPLFRWRSRRAQTNVLPQPWASTSAAAVLPRRRYLEDADYVLPKDGEEENRLNYQHYALNLTLGNHYLAPLPPGVRTIVDVGTGTGIWSCDLARLMPESVVLGFDLDPALFSKAPPANCLLRSGNILTGLPLPDQFADFAHQRFLVLAIPDARWPAVVRELVRITRRGGWLELVETDAQVHDGGPATTQMFAWFDRVRSARGLVGEAIWHLGDLLRQEGLQEIETQTIPLKVGPWGGRAGQMMERDILAAAQALKEPCCTLGVPAQDFDASLRTMAEEWQQGQACCTISVAYGKRGDP